VQEDVLELRIGSGKGKYVAVPLKIGDTLGSLSRSLAPERVGLLEVRVRGVQDDRLPLPELMVQNLGQARIPTLCHAGRIHGRHPLLLVVVHVEMLGLDDLEIERAVLDLVPPEVLGGQHSRREQKEQQSRGGASEHIDLYL
jgi:hypothetical protein